MNDDNRADLDLLVQMFGTLERHFPSKDDQLHFLALAWTVLAQQIRTEALAFPGGFTEKQATIWFRRRFSFSSCFSRCISLSSMPPNGAFQR